ncbi:MAG: tryptophan synthase subunit alpha [Planctomycetes bacterium]|nr:tryptophan synthase subunit alpha [Planctomycetota bacterium]
MLTLKEVFKNLKAKDRCALIPYFMGGYPNDKAFKELLLAAQRSGADMIEVGIPFSDPIADGPTIQEAGQIALSRGTTLQKTLNLISSLRDKLSIPIIIMSYANILFQYGLDNFCQKAFRCGVKGVIIPDLSLEESISFKKTINTRQIKLIQFIAPTTPRKRLTSITKSAEGFIYLISVTGVTGTRPNKDFNFKEYINTVRKITTLPVCIGFGIANEKQAAIASQTADGIIIGSALIEIIKRHQPDKATRAVAAFLKKIRNKMDNQGGIR